jgi:type I restriction enzyme S subunit
MKQLLRLTERPFKMNDDGVYSLVKVRRGNNGVVSRGLYEGRKVLVKSQFKVETDDFIISKRQIVHQACGIVPVELDGSIVSNEYDVFQPTDECCIRYFDYLCYRPQMRHAFFLSCVGVHLEKMLFKTNDWLKRKFHFPCAAEQRKIADFLTAVDGRIGQLSQKKALLEDYKKGAMQQLFTQALRFKDDHGNDFPEWEEKKYSEIYTFQNTNSYSRDLLTYEGGEVRNIHYGDIHTKFRSNFYLSKEVVPFIKPEVELKRISKDCYCRVGDLVIADASEDYADVGKCIEIMELGEKTLAGLHTFIARPRKGAMSPGFGGYLMQSREVRLKIMTIAQGTKVLGLSKNMLCNIKLPIPHPDEQTKIANFLTALDRKIESVAQQITHTQTFKKGLLQQMFV